MKILHTFFLTGIILLYGLLFVDQEKKAQSRDFTLEFSLPVTFQTIAAGYAKQLDAEILFIRTSVFIGGLKPKTPAANYQEALNNNLHVMTFLYPQFIDPYFFCEAFLPSISPDSAAQANSILETGITAYPNDLPLRFFYGTNYFLWMNEPLKGAKAFEEASKIPNAPILFEHLAALLSAQGGQITAGLISLKTMQASEKNEEVRSRYNKEISIFEQALKVNDALIAYQKKYNAPPDELKQLAPEFIPEIPDIKDGFILVYDKPALRLVRPTPLK